MIEHQFNGASLVLVHLTLSSISMRLAQWLRNVLGLFVGTGRRAKEKPSRVRARGCATWECSKETVLKNWKKIMKFINRNLAAAVLLGICTGAQAGDLFGSSLFSVAGGR